MIKFKVVRWRNFLSTGNQFTEVRLDKSPTTLIVGENGAGKSTILDAICFGLFGKPFRNINKGQLINSINLKQSVVEIEFSSGKKNYKVERGIKPNTFNIYCDGNLLNQDASARDYQKVLEESILKLNYKSFTQIVILGSASFTPFMQLPTSHRREIIEDILDIQIFTVMNKVLKDKQSEIKDSLKSAEYELELKKTKAKMQKEYILTLEEDRKKKTLDVSDQINTTEDEIKQYTDYCELLSEQIEELVQETADLPALKQRLATVTTLRQKMMDKVSSIEKEIAFYTDHSECPTCAQSLSADLKKDAIEKNKKQTDEINEGLVLTKQEIDSIHVKIDKISETKEKIDHLKDKVLKLNNQIIAGQKYIQKLKDDLEKAKYDTTDIDAEKNKLKQLAKDVLAEADKKTKIKEEQQYLDACSTLLKDTGIKTKIIKQYLPVINKLVNKYLSAMDFFVHFELDEAFNETIKSRHRDEFTYASFSEGEKQRIDLALLFTWRTIAKMKNSANTNLLMLDEVFDSSLDSNGTDFVINLLKTLPDDTNVFVISHKGDQLFDKFRSQIKFEKHQNFSRIAK